jgi:hypothetical protein
LDRWLGHILKHREFEFIFKTNPVPDGNLGGREVVEGLFKGGAENKNWIILVLGGTHEAFKISFRS